MEFYNIEEVAKLLKVSKMTIYRYAKSGLIRGAKIKGKWFFGKDMIKKDLQTAIECYSRKEKSMAEVNETVIKQFDEECRSDFLFCGLKERKIHISICQEIDCEYEGRNLTKNEPVCLYGLSEKKEELRRQQRRRKDRQANREARIGLYDSYVKKLLDLKCEQLKMMRGLRQIKRRLSNGTYGTGNRGIEETYPLNGQGENHGRTASFEDRNL